MAEPKIFSIQPRFKFGDTVSGWALIDGLFKMGDRLPPYGSDVRDAHLAWEWMKEPMTAGVFSTWVEKAQTLEWKITGGRNLANLYARMLQESDGGQGWTYHEGVCATDYLTTDKGSCEELGRESIDAKLLQDLSQYNIPSTLDPAALATLESLSTRASVGKVTDLQHLDSTRLVKVGMPGFRWRYYPENGNPVSVPDDNIIQVTSMQSPRDKHRGTGYCALSRVIDAKNLMVGYLNYYRQEVGDLPPELIAIINGMSGTAFTDALNQYKMDKKAKGLDEYGKIFWLGSDDPMSPIDLKTISLINSTKSFQWKDMVEWWMKVLALNAGEDVGEFWLLQRGESKTVQSIQALKAKGKGVARYVQEKQRKYNMKIMPYGVKFEYDNPDDDADKLRNEILGLKISNLAEVAKIGVDRQDPTYTNDQIRELAVSWEIIPPEVSGEEMPAVLGAILKQVSYDDVWTVDMNFEERRVKPLLKGREKEQGQFLYEVLKETFPQNGFVRHRSMEEMKPTL